jgi:hypothetical protein
MAFLLAIVFGYLFLVGQYESSRARLQRFRAEQALMGQYVQQSHPASVHLWT